MRTYLEAGTIIRVPGGICYKIKGEPLGEGGGSIIYPVERYLSEGNGNYSKSSIDFALKECYPVSAKYEFIRDVYGEIRAASDDLESRNYLKRIKKLQMEESSISGEVYNTSFRMTPILESFSEIEISYDQGKTFHCVKNFISIMELLSNKGKSIKSYLKEKKSFPVMLTFRMIEQLLYAIREVHNAGYLHLDIQDGNVFMKGGLEDNSGMISLLDFGSSKKRMEDGRCEAIRDGVIYGTQGFSAPEIILKNDGSLRLGVQADIYSVGYLMLLLLTGHRFLFQELYANKTGRYIPRFSLRKTRCPKHLVDRMQAILAKALENEESERYGSTDEMLNDVTEFLSLLAPHKNPLSASQFDAFICYKHGPLDTLAARQLRNALERYKENHLTREKLIRRVFLDEGELASCSDFGQHIRDVLKNSEWLIVICSSETKKSPWVNDEIKTFLEYHDTSHILAVVTEGEPEEVFPEALLKNGMDAKNLFAADARGENEKKVIRKIKRDVKLQIAAPILHTTYDALKQRNKIYEIKRAAVLACVSFFSLSVFFGYAAVKSRQIAQQAIKIDNEHKKALKNQALNLIGQAKESNENHNPVLAMELSLNASKLLNEVDEFMPDTVYTLSKTLGIYTTPANALHTVTAAGIFTLEDQETSDDFFVADHGHYLFTFDNRNIYIWDTDKFQIVRTIRPSWTIEKFDKNCLIDRRNQYLEVMDNKIVCYDYEKESNVWAYSPAEKITGISVSPDQNILAVAVSKKLIILDAKKGEVIQTSKFSSKGEFTLNDAVISISPNQRWIALTVAKEKKTGTKYQYQNILYDIKNNQFTVISNFTNEYSLSFTDIKHQFINDNQLCLLHGKGVNTAYAGNTLQFNSQKKKLMVSMYDLKAKNMLWNDSKDYMSQNEKIYILNTNDKKQQKVLLVYADTCEIVDSTTGKILDTYEMDAPIINVWCDSNKITFVLENGNLLEHSYDSNDLKGYEYFPDDLTACYPCGSDYYIRSKKLGTFRSQSSIIKYQAEVSDASYEPCVEYPKDIKKLIENKNSKDQDSGKAKEVVSSNKRYSAYIENTSVKIWDQEKEKEKILEFEEKPLSVYWMSNSNHLLIGFKDRVSLYHAAKKQFIETEKFDQETSVLARWQQINKSTVIYSGDTYSYVLYVSDNSVGVLYQLKDLLTYYAPEDTFYFLNNEYDIDNIDQGVQIKSTKVGRIKRYSIKDIEKEAEKRLHTSTGK